MNPANIDQWFPVEQQRKYVSHLKGRVGLTRRRAECFVRLWAYLLLKQQQELGKRPKQPLEELYVPEGFVSCTHREAYEIFYSQQERGSDRAAGMMIDKLAALGLIEKDFDGSTTCIRIRSLFTNLDDTSVAAKSIQIVTDAFNPRTDAIPVASLLAKFYNILNRTTTAVPQRIARLLRTWAAQYPTGMRVLRRSDTHNPVGFYVLYPVAPESEENYFLPPSKSLYLSVATENDPITMAVPGDFNCTFVHARSWLIDAPFNQPANLSLLLEDAKKTLIRMLQDFPNLCDVYTLPIHPAEEQLASALGFHKTVQDPQLSLYWTYTPLDKYLALNIEQVLSSLKFD
jgi:hypothetical protein